MEGVDIIEADMVMESTQTGEIFGILGESGNGARFLVAILA